MYYTEITLQLSYKVNSERAVQFRKWATTIIDEYTIKAYVMDDERIKAGGSILTEQYFEEQLQRVREIRLSERKFYQKITDIYATAIDYDVTAQATKRFFATVQNKLHWAIHSQTAAVPVVIVHAEHDEFIRRSHADYLAATIPGAGFRLLPDVSHFAPLQRPAVFDAALLDWLATRRTSGNAHDGRR